MDCYKVPIGFGMALAKNLPAFHAYGAMTEEEQRKILEKARNVRSEQEMHSLVAGIVDRTLI